MDNKYILIVEDEINIVEIIKVYLEKEGYSIYHIPDGREILNKVEQLKPNLILLDLMLPQISGEEICKTIRSKYNTPIIMITAKTEEESIINGLNIGADDYIIKPFSPRQLVARVNAIFRRVGEDKENKSNVLSFNNGELEIDTLRYEVKKNKEVINLTSTEYKIFTLLATNPNKAFTREEIVCLSFNECYEGFDRSIDSHIKNIRKKIENDQKNPCYIKTVHGIGYKFGGEKN
ncbi:DNA-binding response regulator, OmpR family, contains REC and winged-helix (wHTH) domain [Clostridium grantii DSM 8605]|uniref:Stage 0 sporulation protein A homolog n=1 Tax=Clostridium grantii DSM 8605 TaxID=1121316 RepID=A0A1M5X0E6_9CLOT|nr:DNA-binding response regulator, OmpR family, contains REC and winged-helix (wHTH) domain [Clostridium grantii DSM 8605]